MTLKRKATSPDINGKQAKKGSQIKEECIPGLTDNNIFKATTSGIVNYNNKNVDTTFSKFKMETLSPELLNKNHDKKEAELPNIALNQILHQNTKSNLQG